MHFCKTAGGGVNMLARARAVTLMNYADVARYVGLDPFAMLSRAGLHPTALNDPENWLPANRILGLIEDSARQSRRDDFSVLLGECRTFGSLGPVSVLLKHERTLRDVIMAMIEYSYLLNELIRFNLRIERGTAILDWNLIPGLRSSHGITLLATVAYRVLADGAGFDWRPECIHFRHRPPVNVATFSRVFRCRLQFDNSFDGISFPASGLDLTNKCSDPELAVHARRLLNLLPAIRREDTMSDRARTMIPLLLANGSANSNKLAEMLGVSVRTLQRRLVEEGKPFRDLLNETRRELAVRHLHDSDQSIGTVANLLGYSTQSSFTRWFVTEFGTSPREWRRTMRRKDSLHVEPKAVPWIEAELKPGPNEPRVQAN